MTRQEKRRFVRQYFANLQRETLAAIPYMPGTWDGIELREYIADKTAASRYFGRFNSYDNRKRQRAYKTETLNNYRL